MKIFGTTIPLCLLIFFGASAENKSEPQVKKIMIEIGTQDGTPLEFRKISSGTLLQGMANSCNQLGKVAGATNKKEKQKEACSLIASFFQLAANVSKEKEDQKKCNDTCSNDDQKEGTAKATENPKEKRAITDQTIALVLGLVDLIDDQNEEVALRSEPKVYLPMLKDLPSDETKGQLLEQILSNKNEAAGLLNEVMNSIKDILLVSIPEVTENLIDSLKNFFN